MTTKRITILGESGVGKTTYMDAVGLQFGKGYGGYHVPSNSIRERSNVKKKLKYNGATATMKFVEMSMSLRKKVPLKERESLFEKSSKWENFEDIIWTDYRGEAITSGNIEWLVPIVNKSDGIIMIIDSFKLEKDDQTALIYIEALTDIINRIDGELPPIAIVLSKYDLVGDGLTPNKFVCKAYYYATLGLNSIEIGDNFQVFKSSSHNMKDYPPAQAVCWLIEEMN